MRIIESIIVVSLICLSRTFANAQEEMEVKTIETLTVYYVDNSQTSVYTKLNNLHVEHLRERVEASKDDEGDFFLAFTCNGDESKFSINERLFLDKDLPEFLEKKVRSVYYRNDRELFREFLAVQNPLYVKRSIEINFYLSACSVYNLKNRMAELPAPITLLTEIPLYVSYGAIQFKVNYYITTPSEQNMDMDFNKTSIENFLTFYSNECAGGIVRPKVQFF